MHKLPSFPDSPCRLALSTNKGGKQLREEAMNIFSCNELISYSRLVIIAACYMVITSYLDIYGNAISLPENAKVPALLVFGDSIMDPGNNNYLPTLGKGNFLPYGRDFKGGVPTGRYSNGKIPSDLFAEELGIKELVPPYLDPTLQISDLLTGVNFASGGGGYDPKSAKAVNTLTLEDQLNLFRSYINKLKVAVGENTTSTIITQSIYIICTGSNDITRSYFRSPVTRLHYNISSYTDLMVNWASTFIQELYSLGARRVGVMSLPPCGCLPTRRTSAGGLLRECAEKDNQAAMFFNNKLDSELSSLNQKLSGSKLVYLDFYSPLLNLIANPAQYGYEVADRGCCGTGLVEVVFLCNRLSLGTCKNASKYIFWDSFHPTETTYKLLVHELLEKSINEFF